MADDMTPDQEAQIREEWESAAAAGHVEWLPGQRVSVGRVVLDATGTMRVGPSAGFTTKDSGQRRSWDTGSQRDDATGKGRYDLLPWEAVHRVAQLYERGAAKYEDRNWEKGQPLSVVLNSMLRHAHQAAAGLEDEDHLAAVAWNAFAAITILERISTGRLPAELDDLPKRQAA